MGRRNLTLPQMAWLLHLGSWGAEPQEEPLYEIDY